MKTALATWLTTSATTVAGTAAGAALAAVTVVGGTTAVTQAQLDQAAASSAQAQSSVVTYDAR